MLVCVLAVTSTAAAAGDNYSDVSPRLRKQAECMVRVLKKTPYDQVKMGVFHGGGWPQLYVEYLAPRDRIGGRMKVAFSEEEPNPIAKVSTGFIAELPGLVDPRVGPNDGGTGLIIDKWRNACGVSANAVFT